jgi:two-component system, cell cycle response regulator DivK
MNIEILYVEDMPVNVQLVQRMFNNSGLHLIQAGDGEEGLRVARQRQPALILMDINLPDMDGLEVTARLKTYPETAHIPVIALTAAYGFLQQEKLALEAGCSGFLPKPITRTELFRALAPFFPDTISA